MNTPFKIIDYPSIHNNTETISVRAIEKLRAGHLLLITVSTDGARLARPIRMSDPSYNGIALEDADEGGIAGAVIARGQFLQ